MHQTVDLHFARLDTALKLEPTKEDRKHGFEARKPASFGELSVEPDRRVVLVFVQRVERSLLARSQRDVTELLTLGDLLQLKMEQMHNVCIIIILIPSRFRLRPRPASECLRLR